MKNFAEKLSDQEIGIRLRIARDEMKMTQAEASKLIGVPVTMLSAYENGKRRVPFIELDKLAMAYGTSVDSIRRREAVRLNLIPQFKKLSKSEGSSVDSASRLLNTFVSAELELENVIGIRRERRYPPEIQIRPGNAKAVFEQAANDARKLRKRLGLGLNPIVDVESLLELHFGIRLYLCPLDREIFGLFAYEEKAGACMLLNLEFSREYRNTTAAHELAHFLASRTRPEILTRHSLFKSREERYADGFSREFCMPSDTVQRCYQSIVDGHTHLTKRHVIMLAHIFGVSHAAMVCRLEELGLARRGTLNWLEGNGNVSDDQVQLLLGNMPRNCSPKVKREEYIPPRLAMLVGQAWKRELYSEGQIARLLRIDRYSVRALCDHAATEEREENELVKLPC